jgi:hypothetical protein
MVLLLRLASMALLPGGYDAPGRGCAGIIGKSPTPLSSYLRGNSGYSAMLGSLCMCVYGGGGGM